MACVATTQMSEWIGCKDWQAKLLTHNTIKQATGLQASSTTKNNQTNNNAKKHKKKKKKKGKEGGAKTTRFLLGNLLQPFHCVWNGWLPALLLFWFAL